MSQPRKWVLGLVPVVGLLALAGITRQSGVERDLTARGGEVLTQSGLEWAKVSLRGRDATVTGEAPEPDLRALALAAAERTFGIRQVTNAMTVLPEAKPFQVSAVRSAGSLKLAGNAANAAQKAAILDAAKKAMPDLAVTETIALARGAPPSLMAATTFGFEQVSKLSEGTFSLSDTSVSVTGRAADLAKFAEIRAKLAALPAGMTLGKGLAEGDILPPIVKPFLFGMEKTGSEIIVTGFAANSAARNAALALAGTLGKPVKDQTQPGDGAPATLDAHARFAVEQLSKLASGAMSLSDSALSIRGQAATSQGYGEITTALGALPAGMTLASAKIEPPLVKPYNFTAEKTGAGITLSGFVPDDATRKALFATALAQGRPVQDRLQIAAGVPSGDFSGAARLLIGELAKLQTGKAIMTDASVSIAGAGQPGVNAESVRADLKALPAGFTLSKAEIEAGVIRPYLFNATRGPDSVTLSGHVPDAATRTAILDQAGRFFEGERILDTLLIGPGAPKGFLDAVKAGLQDLSRLIPGSSFSLSDLGAGLKGLALHDGARDQILGEFRSRLPAGFTGAMDINTAPPPPPVSSLPECQILYNDALTGRTIRFRSGGVELSVESIGLLDRLVVISRRCTEAKIEVAGHTDSDGTVEANADLSRRRAETVSRFLVSAGISAERILPTGYGASRPVAPNDSAENKAKNRRIEFTVK